MRKVEKNWGYEIIWAETKDYVGKLLHINAGHRLSLHIYDGEGNITKLNPGESFHVTPLQVHRFGANESAVEIMEVSTPHLDDVVRLEDDYGRK